eukprot:Nk52_evm1s2474 gene=Nk52_evmTU1s2474
MMVQAHRALVATRGGLLLGCLCMVILLMHALGGDAQGMEENKPTLNTEADPVLEWMNRVNYVCDQEINLKSQRKAELLKLIGKQEEKNGEESLEAGLKEELNKKKLWSGDGEDKRIPPANDNSGFEDKFTDYTNLVSQKLSSTLFAIDVDAVNATTVDDIDSKKFFLQSAIMESLRTVFPELKLDFSFTTMDRVVTFGDQQEKVSIEIKAALNHSSYPVKKELETLQRLINIALSLAPQPREPDAAGQNEEQSTGDVWEDLVGWWDSWSSLKKTLQMYFQDSQGIDSFDSFMSDIEKTDVDVGGLVAKIDLFTLQAGKSGKSSELGDIRAFCRNLTYGLKESQYSLQKLKNLDPYPYLNETELAERMAATQKECLTLQKSMKLSINNWAKEYQELNTKIEDVIRNKDKEEYKKTFKDLKEYLKYDKLVEKGASVVTGIYKIAKLLKLTSEQTNQIVELVESLREKIPPVRPKSFEVLNDSEQGKWIEEATNFWYKVLALKQDSNVVTMLEEDPGLIPLFKVGVSSKDSSQASLMFNPLEVLEILQPLALTIGGKACQSFYEYSRTLAISYRKLQMSKRFKKVKDQGNLRADILLQFNKTQEALMLFFKREKFTTVTESGEQQVSQQVLFPILSQINVMKFMDTMYSEGTDRISAILGLSPLDTNFCEQIVDKLGIVSILEISPSFGDKVEKYLSRKKSIVHINGFISGFNSIFTSSSNCAEANKNSDSYGKISETLDSFMNIYWKRFGENLVQHAFTNITQFESILLSVPVLLDAVISGHANFSDISPMQGSPNPSPPYYLPLDRYAWAMMQTVAGVTIREVSAALSMREYHGYGYTNDVRLCLNTFFSTPARVPGNELVLYFRSWISFNYLLLNGIVEGFEVPNCDGKGATQSGEEKVTSSAVFSEQLNRIVNSRHRVTKAEMLHGIDVERRVRALSVLHHELAIDLLFRPIVHLYEELAKDIFYQRVDVRANSFALFRDRYYENDPAPSQRFADNIKHYFEFKSDLIKHVNGNTAACDQDVDGTSFRLLRKRYLSKVERGLHKTKEATIKKVMMGELLSDNPAFTGLNECLYSSNILIGYERVGKTLNPIDNPSADLAVERIKKFVGQLNVHRNITFQQFQNDVTAMYRISKYLNIFLERMYAIQQSWITTMSGPFAIYWDMIIAAASSKSETNASRKIKEQPQRYTNYVLTSASAVNEVCTLKPAQDLMKNDGGIELEDLRSLGAIPYAPWVAACKRGLSAHEVAIAELNGLFPGGGIPPALQPMVRKHMPGVDLKNPIRDDVWKRSLFKRLAVLSSTLTEYILIANATRAYNSLLESDELGENELGERVCPIKLLSLLEPAIENLKMAIAFYRERYSIRYQRVRSLVLSMSVEAEKQIRHSIVPIPMPDGNPVATSLQEKLDGAIKEALPWFKFTVDSSTTSPQMKQFLDLTKCSFHGATTKECPTDERPLNTAEGLSRTSALELITNTQKKLVVWQQKCEN